LFEIKEFKLIESISKDKKIIYKMEGVGYEKPEEIEIQRFICWKIYFSNQFS
jgi:hypothetical protein